MEIAKSINLSPVTYTHMKGVTKCITKDRDGNVVSEETNSNNIVLAIRKPIVKLLGSFNNVKIKYNKDNEGWQYVPDSWSINTVGSAKVDLQIDASTLPVITHIKFGSDGSPATIYQTDIIEPIPGASKILAMAPTFSPDGLQVTFAVVFDINEMNGVEFREAGLYTADDTMIARVPIGLYKKIPGMMFEFIWTIGYEA